MAQSAAFRWRSPASSTTNPYGLGYVLDQKPKPEPKSGKVTRRKSKRGYWATDRSK